MIDYTFILMCMVFMHIVDDFYLQGILANMKQKSWWEKNAPQEMYKNDYLMALIIHGYSWSFMIHLPIMVFLNRFSSGGLIISALLHAWVDNFKANKSSINLIEDQSFHIVQIFSVWIFSILSLYM